MVMGWGRCCSGGGLGGFERLAGVTEGGDDTRSRLVVAAFEAESMALDRLGALERWGAAI